MLYRNTVSMHRAYQEIPRIGARGSQVNYLREEVLQVMSIFQNSI
jgi:hypothetical protein